MRCPSQHKLSVHLLLWLSERELYSGSSMYDQIIYMTGTYDLWLHSIAA